MGDTLLSVTTPVSPHLDPHASRSRTSRRRLRTTLLAGAPVLALLAQPAGADVPVGWGGETEHNSLDPLHALGLYLGFPLLLLVLITLAVYLPALVRGEQLLPHHSGDQGQQGQGQWIGGPRQGVAELPAPDGDDSRAGGASGSW